MTELVLNTFAAAKKPSSLIKVTPQIVTFTQTVTPFFPFRKCDYLDFRKINIYIPTLSYLTRRRQVLAVAAIFDFQALF